MKQNILYNTFKYYILC